MTALQVAIDARIIPGTHGGVESVVMGLAQGFSALECPDVKITFLAYRGHSSWLREEVDRPFGIKEVRPPGDFHRISRRARIWAIRRAASSYSLLPERDRRMEAVGADVVHFPLQGPGWVRKPYIYHPHDLQHRHLPQYFTNHQRASRDVVYGAHCRRAAAVAVGTSWVKEDLVSEMNVDPRKIFVVPLAPVEGKPSPGSNSLRHNVPERYLIYPAASWPHKNHQRLFEALARLRKEGLDLPLVLTGSRKASTDLADMAEKAGASGLVFDLGHIPQEDLGVLISAASAMVVPTLFEAASFPIWESFRLGTPVACSTVTSLPRQVGDAALTFDAMSVADMASALKRIWTEPREEAQVRIEKGYERLAELSWEATARRFIALYKFVAGRDLSALDEEILSSPPSL